MSWNPDTLSQGEIHALREAAERAWGDDTRDEAYAGHPESALGQCYNTSRWLQHRLGGSVGRKEGHYFWLSPDQTYAMDLTGDQFGGSPMIFKPSSHHIFSGFQQADNLDGEDTHRFIHRADREFDQLGSTANSLIKQADLIGDAFPAQEPQAQADARQRYFHRVPSYDEVPGGEYYFVYANGQIEASPFHDHKELAAHAGIDLSSQRPVAVGYISVDLGLAHWSVTSNIGAKPLAKELRDYTKRVGWKWGGMTDLEGEPIGTGSEFAPKRTHFRFADGHLYIGPRDRDLAVEVVSKTLSPLDSTLAGIAEITHDYLRVVKLFKGHGVFVSKAQDQLQELLASLQEWASDQGLTLVSGNDNVIKRIEDLELDNIYSPDRNQEEQPFSNYGEDHYREPSGLYRCPNCGVLHPSWRAYVAHLRSHEPVGEDINPNTTDLPPTQMGEEKDSQPSIHFTPQQPEVFPVASVAEARRVDGFQTYARAFGYDDDSHRHYVVYEHGCPVGSASISEDGELRGFHVNRPVAGALWVNLSRHYGSLWAREELLSVDWLRNAGFTNTRKGIWRYSKDQEPKDLLEADLPFIYDIKNDQLSVGQPGERTSDIQGQFTPGGIVEGTYEPGGKVYLTTATNMPYTVRHLVDLWYWTPQTSNLKVMNVFMRDDDGKEKKLAGLDSDVGQTVLGTVNAHRVVRDAAGALMQYGGQVYAVGGAVRDAVLGKTPKDVDLMVQGLPANEVNEILKKLPGKVILTGKAFGVFRYKNKGEEVEIALPRKERSTGDTNKEFDIDVDHTMKPEDDLYRRDFTANAMAVHLGSGQLLDPYGGADDIQNHRLKTVHEHALAEDPVRTLRALTMRARHGLEPDEGTRAQMAANAEKINVEAPDRLQGELDNIMKSPDPAAAIRLAHETGVLKHLLPEVDATFGYDQNNPHHEHELGEHIVNVLDRTAQLNDDPDVRLAALFHDVGKPASAWIDPETGGNHYYKNKLGQGENHEEVGAQMAKERMKALRYPNKRVQRVEELVGHHMFPAFTTDKGARRFINRVGDHADDLMDIREADNGGKGYKSDPDLPDVDQQRAMIENVRRLTPFTDRGMGLAINGNDLIQAGIPPGPNMGQILNNLRDAVVDNPSLNNRETLLEMAKEA